MPVQLPGLDLGADLGVLDLHPVQRDVLAQDRWSESILRRCRSRQPAPTPPRAAGASTTGWDPASSCPPGALGDLYVALTQATQPACLAYSAPDELGSTAELV